MPSTSLRTVVAAVLASALCTSASLAARGENAKLTVAENKVSIAGQPKAAGSTIAAGETIVTGARSRAEVTLPDGTVVRIGQASSFSFDGTKLVLSRGSALFHLTRKNTTIATPALVRTGQPGVVSVHASPSYNALFVLEGTDTVNGTPLVAGQAWVRDGSAPRTFAFDLKKMTSTSTLVTKFPVTPWIANTQALATLQQKLVAANAANPSQVQVVNRTANGATNTAGAKGITLANGTAFAAVSRSGATTGILGAVRSFFSGGNANGSASQGALTKGGGATLTLTQGSAGGIIVNAGNSGIGNTLTRAQNGAAGGTLQISNSSGSIFSGGSAAGATLALNNYSVANTVVNYTSAGNAITLTAGAGALTGGVVNVTAGTLVSGGSSGNTGNLTITSGNLNLTSGLSPGTIVASGGTINGVAVSALQPGQTVALGGITYSVGSAAGGGGLVLTRVGGSTPTVLGARPPSPVPLPPKPPGR